MTPAFCRRLLAAALPIACLWGCAAPAEKSLYEWENYPTRLYEHLRAPQADVPQQIARMKEDLEKIRAKAGSVPPGYMAHLGLLHLATGDDPQAMVCLQEEARAFPEFTPYMQFLLTRVPKP